MRIGLLSDTHIPVSRKRLPVEVIEAFRDVDLILHAGDIYDFSVLNELERIAPVLAARGDDDSLETVDSRVKDTYLLNMNHHTLWLQHRMPLGMIPLLYSGQEAEIADLVRKRCPEVPKIVVFGDTHRAFMEHFAGILFINPGSPTLPEYDDKLGTLAILNITLDKAEAHIVHLG